MWCVAYIITWGIAYWVCVSCCCFIRLLFLALLVLCYLDIAAVSIDFHISCSCSRFVCMRVKNITPAKFNTHNCTLTSTQTAIICLQQTNKRTTNTDTYTHAEKNREREIRSHLQQTYLYTYISEHIRTITCIHTSSAGARDRLE